MSAIEKKIRDISTISNFYEDLKQPLNSNLEIIVSYLKQLIEKYSEQYSLVQKNSVRVLRFYNIVYRIKEKDSFSEKLIRNNQYNLFIDLLSDPASINEGHIKDKIKELDDLIGIKILTDLNVDSINMFQLITSTSFQQDASNKGIILNQEDISNQPAPMKNGLPIFKIRGKYDSYNFELQIKSKLESAWGDMEHAIFYKDYKITPIRGFAQNSMNHVGKLLQEIDNFLKEIRNANINFTTNSEALFFIKEFEDKYSPEVSRFLDGISFNFGKIAALSYSVNKNSLKILNAESLNIDHLAISCNKYDKYIEYRNNNFDLQIFESIVLSNLNKKVNEENIEEQLDEFFNIIKKTYSKIIDSEKIIQDEERVDKWTELFFEVCVKYDCKDFLLNTEKVIEHFNNLNFISESLEVLELKEDEFNNILELFTIFIFKGNIETFIEKTDKDLILKNLEDCKSLIQKIEKDDKTVIENISLIINKLG